MLLCLTVRASGILWVLCISPESDSEQEDSNLAGPDLNKGNRGWAVVAEVRLVSFRPVSTLVSMPFQEHRRRIRSRRKCVLCRIGNLVVSSNLKIFLNKSDALLPKIRWAFLRILWFSWWSQPRHNVHRPERQDRHDFFLYAVLSEYFSL